MGRTEFIANIRAARAELLEVLDQLGQPGDHTLAAATVPDMTWTAKDVLSHLIGYDLAILNATREIREGRPFAWGWTYPSFDEWNESNVAPRRGRPYAAVRTELETTRTALLRELGGWPEDDGPFGPESWDLQRSEISWLGPHEREHTELLAKLGATPPR